MPRYELLGVVLGKDVLSQITDKPPALNFSTKSKKNDVIPAQAGIQMFK